MKCRLEISIVQIDIVASMGPNCNECNVLLLFFFRKCGVPSSPSLTERWPLPQRRSLDLPLAGKGNNVITLYSGGSRISPRRGRQLPGGWGWGRQHTILPNFPKNCMKLKEFGPPLRSATALDRYRPLSYKKCFSKLSDSSRRRYLNRSPNSW